jgi:hypothetical protein
VALAAWAVDTACARRERVPVQNRLRAVLCGMTAGGGWSFVVGVYLLFFLGLGFDLREVLGLGKGGAWWEVCAENGIFGQT